jgi:hypothetical protein
LTFLSGTPTNKQPSSMGCLLPRQVPKVGQPFNCCFLGSAVSTVGVESFLFWKTSKPTNYFLCQSQLGKWQDQGWGLSYVMCYGHGGQDGHLSNSKTCWCPPPWQWRNTRWQKSLSWFCPMLLLSLWWFRVGTRAPAFPVFALIFPGCSVSDRHYSV